MVWCQVIPKQTVEKRGSLVFRKLIQWAEGTTLAGTVPVNASEWSRWNGMSVFARNFPTHVLIFKENPGLMQELLDAAFHFFISEESVKINEPPQCP